MYEVHKLLKQIVDSNGSSKNVIEFRLIHINVMKIYLMRKEERRTKSNEIKTNHIKTSINVTEKFKPIQYKEFQRICGEFYVFDNKMYSDEEKEEIAFNHKEEFT